MVIAYNIATCAGQLLKQLGVDVYVARLQDPQRQRRDTVSLAWVCMDICGAMGWRFGRNGLGA